MFVEQDEMTNKILDSLILFYTIVGLATAAELELTLTRYKGATSLRTGPNRISIRAPEALWPRRWEGVEISDNWTACYRPYAPIIHQLDELPEEDRLWFQRTYNRAYGDDVILPEQKFLEPEVYKFKNGTLQSSSRDGSENFVYHEVSGCSVFALDESIFLVTKGNLPENCAYVWIEYNYVGLVLNDGHILFYRLEYHDCEIRESIRNFRTTIQEGIRADNRLHSSLSNYIPKFVNALEKMFEWELTEFDASLQLDEIFCDIELDELLAQQ